jgi:hypothetical protein
MLSILYTQHSKERTYRSVEGASEQNAEKDI